MSQKRSQVRPVPDFTRAHHFMQMRLEARKKEMKKCTKFEEFNFTKPGVQSEAVSGTPQRNLDSLTPSRQCLGERTQYLGSILRSAAVEKPCQDENLNPDNPGVMRKPSGILKHSGVQRVEGSSNRQQAKEAPRIKRPRVTFDIASPVKEGPSPVSTARRIALKSHVSSPCRLSPNPFQTHAMSIYNFPGRCSSDLRPNRVTTDTRDRRQPPQRVPHTARAISQSCSKTTSVRGIYLPKDDMIVKAINFSEDCEDDVKPRIGSQALRRPKVFARADNTRKPFPTKIHVDVPENESAGVGSPNLRTNSNSSSVVRSPLLTRGGQTKHTTRIPHLKHQEKHSLMSERIDKENFPETEPSMLTEKETVEVGDAEVKQRSASCVATHGTNADPEATEAMDTVEENWSKVERLERKVQRLKRRSQMTDDQSELDRILRKLESLETTIKSLRFDLRSVCELDPSSITVSSSVDGSSGSSQSEDVGSRVVSLEDDRNSNFLIEPVEQRGETPSVDRVCDAAVYFPSIDSSDEKENVDPLKADTRIKSFFSDDDVFSGNYTCENLENASNVPSVDAGVAVANPLSGILPCHRTVFQDITDLVRDGCQLSDDEAEIVIEEDVFRDEINVAEDVGSTEVSEKDVVQLGEFPGTLAGEDPSSEALSRLSISDQSANDELKFAENSSPNSSSEFVQYTTYRWREGVDGTARLLNPVAAILSDDEEVDDDNNMQFHPITSSP